MQLPVIGIKLKGSVIMKKNIIYLLSALTFSVTLVGVQVYVHQGPVDCVYQSFRQKKKLFSLVGCSYSNVMDVENPKQLISPYETDYYKSDKQHIDDLSKQYAQDVIEKKVAPMYLKFISPDVGYGIFATRPIEKGEFVGVYSGELRAVRYGEPGMTEDVDYAWYYTVDSADGKKMIIDGKYKGNELRFINHDNNPNTRRIDVVVNGMFYICYVAQRYIPQDAELTVHYGNGYWTSRQADPVKRS